MRLTEFWRRMESAFGQTYARSVAADQILPQLGSRSADQALTDGEDPKRVWHAVCDATQQPASDR